MSYSTSIHQTPSAPPAGSPTLTSLIGDCQSMAQQAHEALNQVLGIEGSKGETGLNAVPNGSLHTTFEMLHGLRGSLDALVSRCSTVANKFS